MKVEFALTADDVVAFYRYNWKHGQKPHYLMLAVGRLIWSVVVGVGLLIGVLAGVEMIFLGGLSEGTISLLCTLGVLVLLVRFFQTYGPQLAKRLAERNVRRHFKGSEGKAEFRHRCMTLSAEGLHIFDEMTDSIMKWPAIEKIVVTDEHLFLYISPMVGLIVPKRAFSEEWRFAEFAEQARRYHEAHGGDHT